MCKSIHFKTTKQAMAEAKSIIKLQGGKVCFIVETGHMITVEGPKGK